MATGNGEDERRQKSLEEYRRRLIEHRELDAKLKKREGTRLNVSKNNVLLTIHCPWCSYISDIRFVEKGVDREADINDASYTDL